MSNGDKHMDKPKFAYVIDISTSRKKPCNASMDEEMTKQYWVGKHKRSGH
jgi:hypothetical protein